MAVEPEDEGSITLKTLHGRLDKGVWLGPDVMTIVRVTFNGESLFTPEGSDARATRLLGLASSSNGPPITMEVDDSQVIRWFRIEAGGGYSVEVSLPDGPIQFTVPEDLRAASGALGGDCL